MNPDDALKSPIVVLGAARSGTTLLGGTILARHPCLAYWGEPNYVWRYGRAYSSHDVRLAQDATPPIKRYIRAQFARFMASHSGRRFVEKSPGNCFRVPFVLEIFPDARIIHVLRDGRDVVVSAAKDWSGTGIPRQYPGEPAPPRGLGRIGLVWKEQANLRSRVTDLKSLLELPVYAGRFMGVLQRVVLHSSTAVWGPRFPGLRSIRRAYSLIETCALQWDLSVRVARSACLALPRERYMEVRYENLVTRPREETARILEFLDLERSETLIDRMTDRVEIQPRPRWPERLADDDVARVESLVGQTLLDLGYDLSGVEEPERRLV